MSKIFVLSYFTAEEESLHLAVSTDGLSFSAVDGGREVLKGNVGTGAIRDPFVGVGPDGRFHLLGTNGWESGSILHAASDDLLNWGPQGLLPVMSGVTGVLNSWAPEFYLEPRTERARLIWSSVVDPDPEDGPQADLPWNARRQAIWSCATTDFASFTEPERYFDPGYSVIDASVLVEPSGVLMAYKDERGEPVQGGEHNRIHLRHASGGGAFVERGPVSPSPTEGPTLYRVGDRTVMLFDRYLEGRYGALSSADGVDWTPLEVDLPNGVRHAAVLTIGSDHPAVPGLLARAAGTTP